MQALDAFARLGEYTQFASWLRVWRQPSYMNALTPTQLRLREGMLVDRFAAMLGTSRQSIHCWERGSTPNGPTRVLLKLVELYGFRALFAGNVAQKQDVDALLEAQRLERQRTRKRKSK